MICICVSFVLVCVGCGCVCMCLCVFEREITIDTWNVSTLRAVGMLEEPAEEPEHDIGRCK